MKGHASVDAFQIGVESYGKSPDGLIIIGLIFSPTVSLLAQTSARGSFDGLPI